MDFPLFEDVILLVDLPEEGVLAGDIGVVVERHDVPNLENSPLLLTWPNLLRLQIDANSALSGSENALLDLDAEDSLVTFTLKHARETANILTFLFSK